VPQPSRLWPLRARPQPRPIADIHVAIEGEGGTGGNIFSLAQRKGFPPVQSSQYENKLFHPQFHPRFNGRALLEFVPLK